MQEEYFEFEVTVGNGIYTVYGDRVEVNEMALMIFHQEMLTFMTIEPFTVYNKTKANS